MAPIFDRIGRFFKKPPKTGRQIVEQQTEQQAEAYFESLDEKDQEAYFEQAMQQDNRNPDRTLPEADDETQFLFLKQDIYVNSSNVAFVEYLHLANKLIVAYDDRSVYIYIGVDIDEARDLYNTISGGGSVGGWIWDHLRIRGKGGKRGFKKIYARLR